jgi:hypothetical protein
MRTHAGASLSFAPPDAAREGDGKTLLLKTSKRGQNSTFSTRVLPNFSGWCLIAVLPALWREKII